MNRSLSRLLLLSTLISPATLLAQNTGTEYVGTIKGHITSVDDEPAVMVSVSVIGEKKATLTNVEGDYILKSLAPGSYTIRIQLIGAPEKDTTVTVVAGQTTLVNYRLPKENIQMLQEATVTGANNKFSKKESVYISRLPLKNLENPQVYNTVPRTLFEQQVATDLGSIGKNVPGAGIPMIANQGRVTFRSRGFETEPNARNGVAGAAFSFLDVANLERVEALKGPSATLFGNSIASNYGGVYNRVTKKPYNDFGGEVAYYGGSWNYNRLAFDVNTPVNADKTALVRLNGATTFEKSFQSSGYTNSVSLAPSFSYQVNDRLSLLFDVEYGQAKGTSVVRFNPYTTNTTGTPKTKTVPELMYPYKSTFLGDDMPYSTQMINIFAQANYKISGSWTSQTIVSRARSTINGYITALNGLVGDTSLRAQVITGNTNFIATDIQQNFIGDFKIGKLRNRVVIGLDYYNNYNSFDRITVNAPAVNFIKTPASYKVTRFTIDSMMSRGTLRKEYNSDNTYSAYASDVLNITENLLVMASLRINRYEYAGVYNITTGATTGGLSGQGSTTGAYKQTSLSPKMGAVYQLVKNKISVFGNYMNGFINKSGSDFYGKAFKPEQANQLEGGVKADMLDHKLVGTISVYDIQVQNVLRLDPDHADYSIQNGTQVSKGLEVELTANPIKGLNIVAGYAYNNSKFTKADSTVSGLRPALSGPPHTVNFWASYQFVSGTLKGLGIGFGGNMGNESYQTNTKLYKIIIPAYQMFDAALFYEQPKYRISLKVDNITSEQTWSVRLTPQAPARFIGSIALKF